MWNQTKEEREKRRYESGEQDKKKLMFDSETLFCGLLGGLLGALVLFFLQHL